MGCSVSSLQPNGSLNLSTAKILYPKGRGDRLTPRTWTSVVGHGGGKTPRSIKTLAEGLFVDTEFPAELSSIYKKKTTEKHIVWKRPTELVAKPSLISDGTSRHDMKQGDLNDCWFLSTLSAIAEKPQLMAKIIPDDNTFGTRKYDGKFHCRFWQFGNWVDVYIDDLLPTVNGEILFAHSSDPNEFWVSLVEKAYAKLNKSYEALEYGFEADAFTDLTGGLAEWYNPKELKEPDFYLIRTAFLCGAVIGCLSIDKEEQSDQNKKGMISNHSYVITDIEEIPYRDRAAKLVRVRNPWGETEWEGAWSDGCDEWLRVPEHIKLELEVTSQDDGEFWMSFNDFRKEFCNMIICNLSPDFDHDGVSDKAEYQHSLKGKWNNGVNAGGWLECDSFYQNPQYILTLHSNISVQRRYRGRLPLAVALQQGFKRWYSIEGQQLFAIGFEIFQLNNIPSTKLDADFFQNSDPLMPENEETYAEYRETAGRFFLDPGVYLLVPSTHQPNQERDYLLRLFSVTKMEIRPLEYQHSLKGKWNNGVNAGGWLECDSFYQNPQYILTLHSNISVQRRYRGRLPLAVALQQGFKRWYSIEGQQLFAIGFEIFQLNNIPSTKLDADFFQNSDPLMPENEETYAEYRETAGRFFLDPGVYLLVPSTHQPNQERDYLLRLFSVTKMEIRPLGNCLDTG